MHDISAWKHPHDFSYGHEHENERRTMRVVWLTAGMMVAEIAGGWWYNSMALLADGWHMSTHALALGIGVYAYRFARTRANDSAFTFGTGKINALGSFASALILALVALIVFSESLWGLLAPRPIHYDEALLVATLGLAVNLVSMGLLRAPHAHGHGEGHHHHHDHNFTAAHAHVAADALTSLLAIGALLLGKYLGWARVDPVIGIVGAAIIAQWSVSLMRATTPLLLDCQPDPALADTLRSRIEADGDSQVSDLHVWCVAPGRVCAIVSVVTHAGRDGDYYRERIGELPLDHLTIEINRCTQHPLESNPAA